MGLGKKLDGDRSSFDSNVSGSVGWQPPGEDSFIWNLAERSPIFAELLLNATVGRRLTKAVDVFSAGCVIFYVLTRGDHPYGRV